MRRRCHRRVRALLAGAVRVARHARLVEPVLAKLVEQGGGEVALGGDGGGDLGGVHRHRSFIVAVIVSLGGAKAQEVAWTWRDRPRYARIGPTRLNAARRVTCDA